MNDQFKQLDNALALLHDFISNYGAKEADYLVLDTAEKALKELTQ
jgi:hypothetical protein